MEARLAEIYVYPLKSAGGIAVAEWPLDDLGLRYDRRWMLVNAEGRFLSQRSHPRMALLRTALGPEGLTVTAPGRPPLLVPLEQPAAALRPVAIWGDCTAGATCGEEAARWFSSFLDMPCELVRMPDDGVREANSDYAPSGTRVSFADAYPLLLVSQASLDDLNARLERPVPANRFRPNLVVAGTDPFAEDGWRALRIGALEFAVVKPCDRCSIPAVDQDTGERGVEPTRTLATFRRRGGQIYFGQNLVHLGRGVVATGQRVEAS